jgi:hypothetical protein
MLRVSFGSALRSAGVTEWAKYHRRIRCAKGDWLGQPGVSLYNLASLGPAENNFGGDNMKGVCAILTVSILAVPAFAQRAPLSEQGSPTQPVRIEMVCRDMSTTGDYLAPNETMIANKACHPVTVQRMGDSTTAAAVPASTGAQPATPAPATASAAAPAPAAPGAPSAATPAAVFATQFAPVANLPDNSIRVFVTDIQSWTARGAWSGVPAKDATPAAALDAKEAAAISSEVDKLVTEVNQQCPQVLITSDISKASFAVTLDHEKKSRVSERNKIVVFNHNGDDIYSADTRGLGESLPEACKAIVSAAKK